MVAGGNPQGSLPIADAIQGVAQHLATSRDQAWAEIKSKALQGLLLLEGIDEKGRLLGIEPHWLHYIEPRGGGDLPDRESGSMTISKAKRARNRADALFSQSFHENAGADLRGGDIPPRDVTVRVSGTSLAAVIPGHFRYAG